MALARSRWKAAPMKRQATLSPIHHSVRANRRVIGGPPRNMDSIDVTPDQKHKMDAHALQIFTDCANAGLPFADCISAVWFSGVAFAVVRGGKDE